jgi:hypothetical protein
VEDPVDPVERRILVGEVEPEHVAAGGVLLLQRRVVIVAEAVDADDLVPVTLERLGEVRPDEPGRACHQVPHVPGRRRLPPGEAGLRRRLADT